MAKELDLKLIGLNGVYESTASLPWLNKIPNVVHTIS